MDSFKLLIVGDIQCEYVGINMAFPKLLLVAGVAVALLGVVPHASAALDAIAHLDQLICVRESDRGGAEPYAWTALVTGTVDAATKTVVGDIKVDAPSVSVGAKAIIKKGMRAGDRANMPAAQRQLVHHFGDNEIDLDHNKAGFAIIVVVLLDDDGLPNGAVQAGYRRFLEALKNELNSSIKADNGQLPDMQDLKKLRRAIEPKVRRAIKNALSGVEKVLVVLGIIGEDDNFGSDIASTGVVGPATTPFTKETPEGNTVASPLIFEPEVTIPAQTLNPSGAPPIVITPEQKVIRDSYRLEGRFEVRRAVTPAPQPPTPPRPPRTPPRPPGTQEP